MLMTGSEMVKLAEKRWKGDPRFWFIRTNVYRKAGIVGLPKGWADLTILVKGGTVIFAEGKSKGEKQRPDQELFEHRVKKLGFEYFMFQTLDELREKLDKYL